jgi:TRAP-type C4-dicarboxylate transport system permease small subunit
VAYFELIIHKIGRGAKIIGGIFLLATMLVTVANVLLRAYGGVISGSYELIEYLIVFVVACTLGYTAIEKAHIAVDIVISHLSQRVQGILEIFHSIIDIGIWGIVIWTSIRILAVRWISEETYELSVPMLPLRSIWVLGLIFLCLVLLLDLFQGVRKVAKR